MTKALVDGLTTRDGGAISNGPTLPRPKGPRAWGGKTIATPVKHSVQPLGRCEACGDEAAGETGMKQHARKHGGAARFAVVR